MASRWAPGDYDQLHHFISSGVWNEALLEAAEHAFDEIALAIGNLVEGMMFFPSWVVRDDWDRPALSQEATQPIAVISCIRSQAPARRTALIKAVATRTSPRWPGVTSMAMGRPRASAMAWIFVVRPPRERPIACASAPLFRPPPNGAPWLSCCRWLGHRRVRRAPGLQTVAAIGRASSSGESDCRSSSADRRRKGNPATGSRSSNHERSR